MPPRYAYWTIIVDDQPTAFRAGAQEELMPTFKRLKQKHPSAVMMWFQNGKLWPSRLDAQEAMRARGEMGRRNDSRQAGGFRDRKREWAPKASTFAKAPADKQDSRPRTYDSRPKTQDSRPKTEKLDWKPKGEFTPAPKRAERPDWKPKSSFDRDRKPEWKPKGFAAEGRESRRSSFSSEGGKPKGSFDRKPAWKPKSFSPEGRESRRSSSSSGGGKPEWRPKPQKSDAEGGGPRRSAKREGGQEKRAWVPKAEYKKSLGIEARRDDKWRPGGEHRDPKQKYKDAKKAKWTKFKKTIRTRWESKKKKTGE